MTGWIGVDLDGTLAMYESYKGPGIIGEPVPMMVERVKSWLADGIKVKIFTARSGEEEVRAIYTWCQVHLGQVLEVTNMKDYGMITLYDDRCIQVEANTGRLIGA